jgi:hypothetical protein
MRFHPTFIVVPTIAGDAVAIRPLAIRGSPGRGNANPATFVRHLPALLLARPNKYVAPSAGVVHRYANRRT